MQASHATLSAMLFVVLAALAACETQRTITVTSDPTGALVLLNDQEVGRTPVTVPFTFYGTYSVRLERAGSETVSTKQEAPTPWWELPGPDLFALLVPGKRVDYRWHYNLPPVPVVDGVSAADQEELVIRAAQMRRLVGGGGAEAGQPDATDQPPP